MHTAVTGRAAPYRSFESDTGLYDGVRRTCPYPR